MVRLENASQVEEIIHYRWILPIKDQVDVKFGARRRFSE